MESMANPKGRPEVPPEKRLSAQIRARTTEAERQLIEEAAEIEGKRMTTWVRHALVRAAKRVKKSRK